MFQRSIKEKDLFYPSKESILSDTVKRENVEIAVGNTIRLRGWFLSRDENQATVIYFGGNGQWVLGLIRRLFWLVENLNTNVLAVDYRGFGFSDGAPNITSILGDSVQIYDYLISRAPDKKHLPFIFGESIGTLFALYVAAQRPVAGVILKAPFTSSSDLLLHMQHSLPWYLRWFIQLRFEASIVESVKKHLQPIEMIHSLTAPVLIIHGTKDETFPVDFGRRMYEQAGTTNKHWCPVEGAGHNDLGISTSAAGDSLKAFMTEYSR